MKATRACLVCKRSPTSLEVTTDRGPNHRSATAGANGFGPTTAEFAKAFQDKFNARPDYHSASGYTSGVVLQHAIEQAGSIDPEKVTAALNAIDINTFFGHIKFLTDPEHHGLQASHEMVLAQWQNTGGKLGRQVVWPDAAKSAPLLYPIPPATQ